MVKDNRGGRKVTAFMLEGKALVFGSGAES